MWLRRTGEDVDSAGQSDGAQEEAITFYPSHVKGTYMYRLLGICKAFVFDY